MLIDNTFEKRKDVKPKAKNKTKKVKYYYLIINTYGQKI